MIRIFFFLVCFHYTFFLRAQINLTSNLSADQAVQYLLGPNVTYFNAQFTGDTGQLGYLTGGGEPSAFQIPSGVTLSSGHVNELQLGATVPAIAGGVANNPDLLSVANSVFPMIGLNLTIQDVNDQAILEFDFIATGNTLSFDYIFGSDEYLAYVDQVYNDVFAFFLAGPGITGPYSSPPGYPNGSTNIAIIPGSDPALPITISSLNNVDYNQYYIDNPQSDDIGSNGYTVPLSATYPLLCGETYHIKLAIADAQDGSLQSFVTLRSGSFNIGSEQQASINYSVDPAQYGYSNHVIVENDDDSGCNSFQVLLTPHVCSSSPDTITVSYSSSSAIFNEDFTSNLNGQLILYPGDSFYHTINTIVDNLNEDMIELPDDPGVFGEYVDITYSINSGINPTNDSLTSITYRLWILDNDAVNFEFASDTAFFCDEVSLASLLNSNLDIDLSSEYYFVTWKNQNGLVLSDSWDFMVSNDSTYAVNFEITDFCGNAWSDSLVIAQYSPPFIQEWNDDYFFLNFCNSNVAELPLIDGGVQPYYWYIPSNNFLIDTLSNQVYWNGNLDNVGLYCWDMCNSYVSDSILAHTYPEYSFYASGNLNCALDVIPLNIWNWSALNGNSLAFNVLDFGSGDSIWNGELSCCGSQQSITVGQGQYQLNLQDSFGCQAEQILSINGPSESLENIIGENGVNSFSTYNYAINQIAGAVYNWTVTGGVVVQGQGSNFVEIFWSENPEFITVECILVNGCIEYDTLMIDLVNVQQEWTNKDGYIIPGSFGNELILKTTRQQSELIVYNGIGELIHRCRLNGTTSIDTSNWSSGIYYFEVLEGGYAKIYKSIRME